MTELIVRGERFYIVTWYKQDNFREISLIVDDDRASIQCDVLDPLCCTDDGSSRSRKCAVIGRFSDSYVWP